MSEPVVLGALLKCSFGLSPCPLVPNPSHAVIIENMPAATIMDHKPLVNIATFGMCTTQSNPAVLAATTAATTAAAGVYTPTPAPCVPVTLSPWTPGASKVLIGNMTALNKTSKCMCSYGGTITVTMANTFKTQVP